MALLGKPNAYVGLDIGTSSLKVVELVQRHRRMEVATYAEANVPNPLLEPDGQAEDAVRSVANVVTQMMERAGVASDATVAALPSSIVFSTMLYLPDLPEKKMDEAVRFAARDVVPADLNEMFLGWSRVGSPPHVVPPTGGPTPAADEKEKPKDIPTVPIFMTAAPREIVDRYQRVMDLAGLELVALEVETFPLVRSLLTNEQDSAMIVDIGDRATAYHIVDRGTARISHSIDYGGSNITFNRLWWK
jgi:type IV pilus assembly protein PilM